MVAGAASVNASSEESFGNFAEKIQNRLAGHAWQQADDNFFLPISL
jgi:hypothetical protein